MGQNNTGTPCIIDLYVFIIIGLISCSTNSQGMTFERAQLLCEKAHTDAQLISISSPAENAFVYENAKLAEKYYNMMWIGMKRDENGKHYK